MAYSQTCCSGGVPISSNLGFPPSDGKTLQIQLRYNLNVLETLKTGLDVLDDDARNRTTHSTLIRLGYNITERLSVDGLFAFVRQERTINQFGNEDFTFSQGLGDAVLLFKYKVLTLNNNNTVLSLGAGPKIPLGPSDLNSQEGIPLNADLQPGSGAWDAILWAEGVQNLAFRPSMSLSARLIYALKGTNNNYLGEESYQFGNEIQVITSLSDRVVLGKALIDPTLSLRFRSVTFDRFNNERLPSTGGSWWFIRPGLNYWIKENLSIDASVELPIYSNILGTQVTPTYIIDVGIYYRLNF